MKIHQIMSQRYPAVRIAIRYEKALCEWKEVPRDGTASPLFVADGVSSVRTTGDSDAWTVREEFFAITKREQMLPFLRRTGRFTRHVEREEWSYEDFATWRTIIRFLIKTPPDKWERMVQECFSHERDSGLAAKFAGSFRVNFAKEGKFYVGVIVVQNALMAMIASVYLDWMAGIKQGFCERLDCGKPYEITSSHKRRWCSPACAHFEVVRRHRNKVRQKLEAGEQRETNQNATLSGKTHTKRDDTLPPAPHSTPVLPNASRKSPSRPRL